MGDVCQRLMASGDEESSAALFDEAADMSIGVEMSEEEDWFERASSEPGELDRFFRLPTGKTVRVREISFDDGGLGHSVWDASVGMSIWLSVNTGVVDGQRVLELGSGVGFAGMSAQASAGASSTVLSDFVPGRDYVPAQPLDDPDSDDSLPDAMQLVDKIDHNLRANGLSESTDVIGLDWGSCLAESFEAAERFPVVMGTDLIYQTVDAAALCAAIVAHTALDGTCFLMSTPRSGCTGVRDVFKLLEEAGTLELEDFSLVNEFGASRLVLSTWRHSK